MTGEPLQPAEEWRRTHPLAVVASGLSALQKAVLPILAVIFGSQAVSEGSGIAGLAVIPIVLAIIAINLLAAWLGWIRLQYRVGENDIRVEKGLIARQARAVPYERIQDVSLEQKPIPRLLGLVEVRFETGAGGKDEMKLAYVSREEGERLREVVRDQRDEVSHAAPEREESPRAEEQGTALFRMTPERLFVFGLFEFSLVVIAVVAGAAQQFDFLLPFDLWDFEGWEERLAGPGAWLAGLGWASRIVGAVVAALVLVTVGVVTGVGRTFLRDWDFRLDRTPKGFRRRRGLLTKTDVVMPVHRVQASVIDTGILRRLWGWHGLSFISLAQDAKSANHTVAPFARMEEIEPIVSAADFTLPAKGTQWHRPSPKYRFDKAVLSAGTCLLAALAFLVAKLALPPEAQGLGLGAVIMLVFALVFGIQQAFLWRYERHAIDSRQILSRSGWLAPKLRIADRVKLHSVQIAQGPLGKWRGYADLKFGLAGGTLAFHGLPLAEAEQMRSAVLSSIAAIDFSRLPR